MPRSRNKIVTSIGCGIIGQAWTILFSCKGYHTKLYHPKKERLELAFQRIESTLHFLDQKGFLRKNNTVKELLSRITLEPALKEALAESSFVQESLPEKEELKEDIFRTMDRLSDRTLILSSSTSSLSMTQIQKRVTRNPGRCITAHPFNPPYLVPLVEIVPGTGTFASTVKKAEEFFLSLDRVPIVVRKEVEGFVGNRLAGALWREAIDLVVKGVASAEEVDKAVYAGLGLRWAIMGQHLIYTINGGEGGMPEFIARYGARYGQIWASMDPWTKITQDKEKKLVQSIKKMREVKVHSYEELVKQRDEKLISVLRSLQDYKL